MSNDKLIKYLKNREIVKKAFLIAINIAYGVAWYYFAPADIPLASFLISFVLIPVNVCLFHYRTADYVWYRNGFHVAYWIASTAVFGYTMWLMRVFPYNSNYVMYELAHLLVANVFGMCVAIAVSFPFKMFHGFYFDADLYFDGGIETQLYEEAFPERKVARIKKEKVKHQFDGMNETQLNAELQSALKEERFEDAEKIKKILETKFR